MQHLRARMVFIAPQGRLKFAFACILPVGPEDVSEISVLFDKLLVLAPALDGTPGANEGGHLFEDLDRPTSSDRYLLYSLLVRTD